ncbi:hypothetical protein M0805_003469 [Coniferiporia weirii]|nr:hypothetical protein M0805_003469 [Coniferiporia weirii]
MYSNPLLSFITLLFIELASANVVYSVSDQLPLIARVGQPYSWSISPDTFEPADHVSASSLPSWLSFSNLTFTGTPSMEDEGSVNITLVAGAAKDSFSICVTHFPPPVLYIPLATQFNDSNPSMSSVFPLSPGSALESEVPTVRVPLHWSFSIGFEGGTFTNENDLFYYAQLANGSLLPDWITFDGNAVTFDGVARAPPLGEGERIEMALIASDQEGYSAVRAPFDIIIESHELSSTDTLVLNTTRGEYMVMDFVQDDWIFAGVLVDNSSIHADNITSLFIDTSSTTWLSYDSNSRTLNGTAPPGDFAVTLPMTLSAFNQTLTLNVTIDGLVSYFKSETIPGVSASPGSEFTFDFSPWLSNDSTFSGHDVSLSANSTASPTFFTLATDSARRTKLTGRIPQNLKASHVDIVLTAYDHTTHAISHAQVSIAVRTSSTDSTARDAFSRRRRLVLGLSIGLGSAVGIFALTGSLAIIRKYCRVQDTGVDPYSRGVKSEDKLDIEKDGYGWSEKAGLGLTELPSAYRTPYPDVGIGYTRSLVPGSPSPKKMTKAAFFTNVKAAMRNFSGGSAATVPKRFISKPVLMSTEGSSDSLRALRAAAGLNNSPGVGTRHAPVDSSLGSGSLGAPENDGLSLGLGSGLSSSPTSSTGHSNETGRGSVPRQRADFGPSRTGNTLAVTPLPPIPRARMPPVQGTKQNSKSFRAHIHRRSTDTRVTQSSSDRDEELEEAVIVTASHAPSICSARSSNSHAPSTVARNGGGTKVSAERPRLVQFTSARGVPAPVPTLTSLAGPSRDPRRVSQVAAIVSPSEAVGNADADTDAIMTEGMRYVRAFGDQTTAHESATPSNLGRQPPPSGALSSRSNSNSKRSSYGRGGLSPATTTGSGSPVPTQSSYIYPSPSQSIESGVGGHKGSTKGSRGSLVMSRIIVRTGEAFVFKYPVVIPSPTAASSSSRSLGEKDLTARLLYGGGRLPAFLAHSVSVATLSSSPGKKHRKRFEVEFWGTPAARDVGEVVVGIFLENDGHSGSGECVGRLVVDVVTRG